VGCRPQSENHSGSLCKLSFTHVLLYFVCIQGGREVNDFIKYLAKAATDELSGYTRDGKKKKDKKTEL